MEKQVGRVHCNSGVSLYNRLLSRISVRTQSDRVSAGRKGEEKASQSCRLTLWGEIGILPHVKHVDQSTYANSLLARSVRANEAQACRTAWDRSAPPRISSARKSPRSWIAWSDSASVAGRAKAKR